MNKECILSSKNELTISFEKQHEKIVSAAAKVGLYLYEFCKALKEMKESKLYLSVGYESFEDYSLRALNIKKSQAYTYIKICDNYSPQFFQSTGKIGVTKLELLSSLPEDEATEFIKNNNIENLSVKQVKKTLAAYKDKKDQLKNYKELEEINVVDVEMDEEDKIYSTFGEFMRDKRLSKGYSLRQFASLINHAHSYVLFIERGKRKPIKIDFYHKVSVALELTPIEEKEMYRLIDNDFASINKVSPIILDYIVNNESINKIIQSAIDNQLTNNKLDRIISVLEDGRL